MLQKLKSVAKAMGIKRPPPHRFLTFSKSRLNVANKGQDDFSKLFYGYKGNRQIHKWNHYLPIYSRIFAPYRNQKQPLRFLEIGVWKGGSLEMWRSYFGKEAVIFGIDIDPKCMAFNDGQAQVRIGSQADAQFLRSVVEEMGGVDIILDDGSHIGEHQRASFETLFPLLADDGIYVVEDTHTSYWRETFQGGLHRPGTFIEFTKSLIDDMHVWYHGTPNEKPKNSTSSIQIFDSIVVFEKSKPIDRPFHVRIV